ncbi:MAG: HlyD family efflux transporter periplasmic adaptor subunit [bacterium]|nr:HlyD family efflux transporter periplasmic adaptor subunit [bacterium]
MTRRFRSALAAVALLGAALTTGCGGPTQAVDAEAELSTSAVFQRGDFERSLLLSGELQAVNSIAIKAPQTNIFQMRIQFMAEEGSVIESGEPLLDFDNSALAEQVRDLESRILDAETQIVTRRNALESALKDLEIEVARREFEAGRTKLEAEVDREVLSPREHGERQLALSKAIDELKEVNERIELTRERGSAELDVLTISRDKLRKDLISAQEGVDLLSIRSPGRGLVVYEKRDRSTLRYQEGDSCWPGQTVIRLPDLSAMEVVFSVNEVDAPLLETGMSVSVKLDAFPGRKIRGSISNIPSMAVKRDERSKIAVFRVTTTLDETWVGEMKPGMSARGAIVVESRSNAPLVARRSVRYEGGEYWLDRGQGREPERIEPVRRNERFYVLSEEEYARLTGDLPVVATTEAGS